MTTDKTYTNQELVDRIEKATRDKDKLQKIGGKLAEIEDKPICHYINGTKLYTKEYVEELERRLKIAVEALESIAFMDEEKADNIGYWMNVGPVRMAETMALDTEIAREALAKIKV